MHKSNKDENKDKRKKPKIQINGLENIRGGNE